MHKIKHHMQYWFAFFGDDYSLALVKVDTEYFHQQLADVNLNREDGTLDQFAALLTGFSHPYTVLILSDIKIHPWMTINITHLVNSQTFGSTLS